jgi:hypothetical protein
MRGKRGGVAAAALEREEVLGDRPAVVLGTQSAGTRTSSKNTWLNSCSPASVGIGATVMPGRAISRRRKVMPVWGLPSALVRTRQNIRCANCACVVQILEPFST